MSKKLFIDFHVVQTVPFSNLNRDDTGSPKTGVFGGVTRARVSSQAQKAAIRRVFAEMLPDELLATRSKRWPTLIRDRILAMDPSIPADRALALALEALAAMKIGVADPKTPKEGEEAATEEHLTKYLLFFGAQQIDQIAEELIRAEAAGVKPDAKRLRALASTNHSIEVALFGRMVADDASLNVDACCQLAHAVSVHSVEPEWDFFTAVDDEKPEESLGAGMMGTVEFNSSTMYRYASLNVHRLAQTLGDEAVTAQTVSAFARAFITTLPSGKSNTFANFSLPEAVVVTVRNTQPINYAGAFEDAITARDGASRAENAAKALEKYASEITAAYGQTPVASYVIRVGDAMEVLERLGKRVTLDELLKELESLLESQMVES